MNSAFWSTGSSTGIRSTPYLDALRKNAFAPSSNIFCSYVLASQNSIRLFNVVLVTNPISTEESKINSDKIKLSSVLHIFVTTCA